ncbi:MAG TPA: RHS repeat-associated core domain-containing protein, partial [Pyrinomonadaceae bacterium]|nr:RHS repeat-associated core domain-containing protein [Pyrinomonadaceae bacterium]
RDFMPYGEEIARSAYGSDSVRQKFTTYERDSETSLDFAQARMHSFNLGRFSSPDPMMGSARRINPQTFNRYVYTLNNPVNLVDPLGLSDCPPGTTCVSPSDCKVGEPGCISSSDNQIATVTVNGSEEPQELIGTSTTVALGTVIATRAPLLLTGAASTAGTVSAAGPSAVGCVGFLCILLGERIANYTPGGIYDNTVNRPRTNYGMPVVSTIGSANTGANDPSRTIPVPIPIPTTTTDTMPPPLDGNLTIVRGGTSPLPDPGTVFSGAFGSDITDAAAYVPHGQIRVTTVRAIIDSGGSVVPVPEMTRGGNLNLRHVNIVEGRVSTFSPLMPNPVPTANRIK